MLLAGFATRFRRVTEASSYVPQIDGLRFLAIIPVLVWHSCIRATKLHSEVPVERAIAWLPHGHIGVELFFFISGYIIAYPFLAERAPTLRHFYLRRLFRLEPPYILAMTVAFLALTVSGYRPVDALSFQANVPLWQSLIASLGYVHWLVFGAPSTINPPAWSLEVEIQFYMLSPFLLLAYTRLNDRRRRIALLVVAAVISTVVSCWLDTLYGRFGLHRWTLVGHAPMFLLGIAISDYALVAQPFRMSADRRFDLLLVLGAFLFLGAGMFWIEQRADLAVGVARDIAKLIAAASIYLGVARGQTARRVFGHPAIALIGGMCYSIYLTHVMVMQAAHLALRAIVMHLMPMPSLWICYLLWAVVLVPTSIAFGFVFYIVVERPCMVPYWPLKLIDKWRKRSAVSATAEGAR